MNDRKPSLLGTTGEFLPTPTAPSQTGNPDTTEAPPASDRSHGPLPFPEIPGYELIRELGRGGMGAVYEAQSKNLNRRVALKIVLGGVVACSTAMRRFFAEAEALAALQHPNIVQVFDRGEYQGLPYFTMEFCPNGSLSTKVKDQPLAAREAAQIVEQLAQGVAAAHAHGILHRDLKPDNVLFSREGTPRIADFGLSKRFDESSDGDSGLTHTGAVMGTPSYMAPEQAKGETKQIGPGVDVHALGAILYRLVTGRPPFLGANSTETIRQVIDVEPVSPTQLTPGLSRDLATICLKCLAKEPARRYASALELSADLRRFLEHKPILAKPVGPIERALKWVRRNPVVAGATVAVVLALSIGTTVSYMKYRDAEAARTAESKRVEERDEALGKANDANRAEAQRLKERDAALDDANHQLGIGNTLLAVAAYDNRDMPLVRERLDKVPAAQRGWEWRYLRRLTEGGIFTCFGHTSHVTDARFSPDGSRIVTGSQDQTAKVWDARTGRPLLELKGHTNAVDCVCFSPDGTRIVTGSLDKTAKVWDAGTGMPLFTTTSWFGVLNNNSPLGRRRSKIPSKNTEV